MLMTSWWAGIDRFPPQLAAEVYFHADMAQTAFTPPRLWRLWDRTGDDWKRVVEIDPNRDVQTSYGAFTGKRLGRWYALLDFRELNSEEQPL